MKLMRSPRSVDLKITARCNLRCSYCYHFTGDSPPEKDLVLSCWIDFIDHLAQCQVLRVSLTGGEPFLREDISNIIDAVKKNPMRFKVFSNGILIGDAEARMLAQSRRCDGVQVSLDGSGPASHDPFRGKGSFHRAVEGIRHLQAHGVPVTVKVTIHRENYQDLEHSARYLLDELNLPGFSTNSAYSMGLCRKNEKQVALGRAQLVQAGEVLKKLDEKYPGRIKATAGPLWMARRVEEIGHIQRTGKKPPAGGGYLTGCRGVFKSLAVRADGVIIPCNQLPHMELGRINRDSLMKVWQESPLLKDLRNRASIPLSDFETCRGCPILHHCTGGCPGMSYLNFGDENVPDTAGCLGDCFTGENCHEH